MSNCETMHELMAAAVDGEINADEQATLDTHLGD